MVCLPFLWMRGPGQRSTRRPMPKALSALLITQSGFNSGVMALAGICNPWPERTRRRTHDVANSLKVEGNESRLSLSQQPSILI